MAEPMKATEILFSTKTVWGLIVAVLLGYGWMFTTFVSASDFDKHIQTYQLDRTDDKIDDLEVEIFNLKELMLGKGNTPERRKQLSKYEGALIDYRKQQTCFENRGANCRRDK
jgi:hypothetical protein